MVRVSHCLLPQVIRNFSKFLGRDSTNYYQWVLRRFDELCKERAAVASVEGGQLDADGVLIGSELDGAEPGSPDKTNTDGMFWPGR